ncbi:matrixin family metalloprotease [Lyngbya confervoides]|uniref:Matrixin family metalloprotease n=1 Tax=Lyngbya confervoides BDU141951 TaxID=1574623 RepID=A0ABD4T1A1_9CYAN|nr:matrixin family metalloprotease [Lyngbya confervoides]MCM1982487.1 matrixin family metalloprotease [Lyngbya confervoides BDU141951]
MVSLVALLCTGLGSPVLHEEGRPSVAIAQAAPGTLDPKPHPLPAILQTWSPTQTSEDYFDQISQLSVGYLVWGDRPVSVYVAPSQFQDAQRSQLWQQGVNEAIGEWQKYFPLQQTQTPNADIVIEQVKPNRTSQGRVRSGQAIPAAYCDGDRLAHRFQVQISPTQASQYIRAATRHELGHALGIWGHSPNPEDVLYAAQVRQPPPISDRDINTLKRIYQQPTLLGWPAPGYCPNS